LRIKSQTNDFDQLRKDLIKDLPQISFEIIHDPRSHDLGQLPVRSTAESLFQPPNFDNTPYPSLEKAP
jgi:hypothetical protein